MATVSDETSRGAPEASDSDADGPDNLSVTGDAEGTTEPDDEPDVNRTEAHTTAEARGAGRASKPSPAPEAEPSPEPPGTDEVDATEATPDDSAPDDPTPQESAAEEDTLGDVPPDETTPDDPDVDIIADIDAPERDAPDADIRDADTSEPASPEPAGTEAGIAERPSFDHLPVIAGQLDPQDTTWWQDAIFYQIYPRSFSDLDGDGVGDLAGVIDKLGYLELLGIDALWLSPIMVSPMADHGYDVADPRDIDPLFGDLDTFDTLIAEAHDRDIRVTMDIVPNHTSDQHVWFREALAAGPGSRERDRYIFRDGRGADGSEPPNNWVSVFGGPAWTRVTEADGEPGQWYLHIFAAEQPDLNWDNPEVFDDLEHTLRFWLNRGVDGFRIDVAHGMAKPEGLPDYDIEAVRLLENDDNDLRFNNAAVHEIHRKIRRVMDDYPAAANVGEIWVHDNERFAEYLRPDELHLGFNFRLAKADFDVESIREAIENSLDAIASVGGTPTWTLSNHDVVREVSRYSSTGGDPDFALADGTLRARAMLLVELALPGTVFIYNGAELGLPHVDLPDEALQDPVWERSGHTERGRDGARVPIPWEGLEPPFGFSTTTDTWLPMPADWAPFTVEAQLEDIGSTLSLYRQAIELRYERSEFAGPSVEWYGAPEGCMAFRRTGGGLICALNATDEPIPLPQGELLLTSFPLIDGMLPPNSAAWLV